MIASAPGKCIIIGEHAVVYGEPAIIATVNLRTIVTAEKSDRASYRDHRFGHNNSYSLEEVKARTVEVLDLWEKCNEKKNFSPLFENIKANKYENYKCAVVGIALDSLGIEDGVSIDIDSNVPAGAGLGSSSSLEAALTQAVAAEYEKKITVEEINDIVFKMEQIIHGTPSGGDNSACCFGRLIWFQKGNPNIIKPLDVPKLENFVLVHIKPPEKNTGELVQIVRNLDEGYRTPRVKEIGSMVPVMLEALKKKDMKKVRDIINKTQKNLAELGVSIKEIDDVASAVREIGGAAKLCGAGGGGTMLCHHDNKEKLIDVISSLGYKPLQADLAVEGVRVE